VSEPGPAERYARARDDQRHPITAAFAASQKFTLDPFQVAGCHALEDGSSVLVAAPTGAGKTIVGEFAIHLAMRESAADPHPPKAFYTTPMKALSNQKFRELVEVYGADQVGLLTGDTNINGNARVVVMTTEVLRNMLYAGSSALKGLRYVVMDEVHYLADRFRGAVWEEVIIHLPADVRLISLSATVSNAEEFGDWLDTVRGDTEVIVSEIRPVPLEQHVLVRGDLLPLFDDRAGIATAQVNQELMRIRSFKGANFENNRRSSAARSAANRSGGHEAARPGTRAVHPASCDVSIAAVAIGGAPARRGVAGVTGLFVGAAPVVRGGLASERGGFERGQASVRVGRARRRSGRDRRRRGGARRGRGGVATAHDEREDDQRGGEVSHRASIAICGVPPSSHSSSTR